MAENVITKSNADYGKLVSLLTQVDAAKTTEIAQDGQLTRDEILDVFDGDNNKFELADLSAPTLQRQTRLFGTTNNLLYENEDGFSLYHALPLEERVKAVETFVKSGVVVSESLKYTPQFLGNALWKNADVAKYIPHEMWQNYEWLAFNAVWSDAMALQYVPQELLSRNVDLLTTAVCDNGDALQFIPEDLQIAHPETVVMALINTQTAFEYVTPGFQMAYPEIMAAMIGILGDTATNTLTPEFLAAHRDIATMDWDDLRGQSLDLEDADSMLAWVTADGTNLQYVPHEIQNANTEIVLAALLANPEALEFTSSEFQQDNRDLLWAILNRSELLNPEAYYLADDYQMQETKDLLTALHRDPLGLTYLAPRLSKLSPANYFSCVQTALKSDGMALQFVPKALLKRHPELIAMAVKSNPSALQFTDATWQVAHPLDTRNAVIEGYKRLDEWQNLSSDDKTNLHTLRFVTPEFKRNHPKNMELAQKAILAASPYPLADLPEEFLTAHPDLLKQAIDSDGYAVKAITEAHLPETFLEAHIELVEKALEDDPYAVDALSDTFQTNHPDTIAYGIECMNDATDRSSQGDSILTHISPNCLRADPSIIETAINWNADNLHPFIEALNDAAQGISGPNDTLLEILLNEAGSHLKFDTADAATIAHEIQAFLPKYFADLIWRNPAAAAPLSQLPPDLLSKTWEIVRAYAKKTNLDFPPGTMDSIASFNEFMAQHTQFPERFDTIPDVHEVFVNGEKSDDPRPVALLLYNTDDWNGAFHSSDVIGNIVDSKKFRVVYREVSADNEVTEALDTFSPVHTLVLAGHGSKTTLRLGKTTPERDQDTALVDTADYDNCDDAKQSYFVPDGQILLYACSNGEGGEDDDNLHNAMALSFPGVSILSSPEPSNIDHLNFDEHLHLTVELAEGTTPVISTPSQEL